MSKDQNPPVLNKNDPESLYSWVAYKVSSPEFRNPIKNFIDENCITFLDIEENSFEQGQLYKEMNLMIENLLNDVLAEGNISQEDFLKCAERGMEDKKYKKYFNQIINFGDYTFFKNVMVKRNFQLIKLAEMQMNQDNGGENENEIGNVNEEQQNFTPEMLEQMKQNEQNEINAAIQKSLEEEDEKRRIAAIEEEEMRRAIKQSLEQSKRDAEKNSKKEEPPKKPEPKKEEPKKPEPKKEEPKKPEPKKEEPKKEEPKKEEPKKPVLSVVSSNASFQVSGEAKEKAQVPQAQPNKSYKLQVSTKSEDFGISGQQKEIENPYARDLENKQQEKKEVPKVYKTPEIQPQKKETPVIEEQKKKVERKEIKQEENVINEPPQKEERIGRDFLNIFEEKKMTLAPLVNKAKIENQKKTTLKEDVQRNQKENVKKDIEKMNKMEENKTESASDIIKSSLKQSTMNKNDINFIDDDGGLLIDEDDEDIFSNAKSDNKSKNNIHLGRIAIPQNFNNKIVGFDKEKQEQLQQYREKVLEKVKNERESKANNN